MEIRPHNILAIIKTTIDEIKTLADKRNPI